nr:PREDICTED: uncharacterized protein LOC106704584 [Latimeria chalumnae]|eukprot:XP_014347392.1 PREDICTED: uncharacterized protein LOC106704584 [Latimeria chalumnae]
MQRGQIPSCSVFKNPLKTIIPTNASRRHVVDKNLDLLMFSYWAKHLANNASVPARIRNHPFLLPTLNAAEKGAEQLRQLPSECQHIISDHRSSNSLAPFYNMSKPTCGYRFSRDTDHKRRNIGIPPSNITKWRSSNEEYCLCRK